MISKEQIIELIRATAADNGGAPLGQRRFETATGTRQSDWLGKHWLRWSDALAEAGFAPNPKNEAISDDRLSTLYASLTRELRHLPLKPELMRRSHQDPAFPTYQTFLKFGLRSVLHARLAEWCPQNGFGDVAHLFDSSRPARPKMAETLRAADEAVGLVYLLKSGRFYKVGKTNAVGRREREISIQMPQDSVIVHEIRTDDPTGIEQYWHRRFSGKRARGEWFSLSSSDVAAFKRRQFM